MKRTIDMILAVLLLIFLSPLLFVLAVCIKLTSPGPVFYWSDRVGSDNKIFKMCKFRTMQLGAPTVATHLLTDAELYLTPVGHFLRRFSLDELPQLLNIVSGDMSFVGPRPALFNQDDLIELRTSKGVHKCVPGVTGWAQINGRDDLPIPAKVDFDEYYVRHRSFALDAKIMLITIFRVINGQNVQH
jgi:O-antigen biosynthesis protein WbqP